MIFFNYFTRLMMFVTRLSHQKIIEMTNNVPCFFKQIIKYQILRIKVLNQVKIETPLMSKRQDYSLKRIEEYKKEINSINILSKFPNLTIYAAGSYGRLEAWKYSDIDLFFLLNGSVDSEKSNINQIQLFSNIIEISDKFGFPPFSNDGEFLKVLSLDEMIEKLGGQFDDYENHFTARMLLLLESKCLFNDRIYKDAITKIIESYFRDYPKHKADFRPVFLINDIIRYWKTLCLNYENKRNQPTSDPQKKLKQKIKNFKLKISRMTTCFATIAALSCQLDATTCESVIKLVDKTPMERLQNVVDYIPDSKDAVDSLHAEYEWFLGKTGLTQKELEGHFKDEKSREKMFDKAECYSQTMFEVVKLADKKYDVFKYLVK